MAPWAIPAAIAEVETTAIVRFLFMGVLLWLLRVLRGINGGFVCMWGALTSAHFTSSFGGARSCVNVWTFSTRLQLRLQAKS